MKRVHCRLVMIHISSTGHRFDEPRYACRTGSRVWGGVHYDCPSHSRICKFPYMGPTVLVGATLLCRTVEEFVDHASDVLAEHRDGAYGVPIVTRTLVWLERDPGRVCLHEAKSDQHVLELKEVGVLIEETDSAATVMTAMLFCEIALSDAFFPFDLVLRRRRPRQIDRQHLRCRKGMCGK